MKDTVVIDIGSLSTRLGFSGDESPIAVYPSVSYTPLDENLSSSFIPWRKLKFTSVITMF